MGIDGGEAVAASSSAVAATAFMSSAPTPPALTPVARELLRKATSLYRAEVLGAATPL